MKISIIGKKNVGKSTLFNILTKSNSSIIIDYPGFTRDRIYEKAKIGNNIFDIIDTAGIDYKKNKIDILTLKQTLIAIEESNIIITVFDAKSGISNLDESIIKDIKKTDKTLIYVINKIDCVKKNELLIISKKFYFENVIYSSFKQKIGINEILDKLAKVDNQLIKSNEIKKFNITVIGKPNTGKSSFINKILNQNRIIIHDEPGTTRDIIKTKFFIKKKELEITDTPGLNNINPKNYIEKITFKKNIKYIKKSNIIILMIDIKENITKHSLHLIQYILNIGKPIMILINKSDLINKNNLINIEKEIKEKTSFAKHITYQFISSKYGFGIKEVIKKINIIMKFQNENYSSFYIKKKIRIIFKKYKIKKNIYFANIEKYDPLIINVFTKKFKNLPKSYKKFLMNSLIRELNIINIPLKIKFKTT